MWIELLCVCSFSHGVTWYKSRSLIGPWGQGQSSGDMFFSPGGHVTYFMQISHVIPFSRSDWLRAKFAAL